MRANHTKYLAVFLMTILFSLSCKKNSIKVDNCLEYPKPADTYIYPAVPGTQAWNNLKPEERLPACQIPSNVVSKLSTEALVQSWIDFPLNFEIIQASSLQSGITFFMKNFSGLAELIKRNDAGSVLLKRYQSINPSCIANYTTPVAQGDFSFDIIYVEILLAQDPILHSLDLSQKKSLVSTLLQQYDAKLKNNGSYGDIDIKSTLLIGIKVMLESNYSPFITEIQSGNIPFYSQYLQTGVILTDNMGSSDIAMILNHLKNFIK